MVISSRQSGETTLRFWPNGSYAAVNGMPPPMEWARRSALTAFARGLLTTS
jgi:hypothetical protein